MAISNVVLVANSPGELSALVRPVAAELAKNTQIILVLTPCQYTSGREVEFAKTIPAISRIITAAEYKKWALLNQKPSGIAFSGQGVVLFLGGDLAHAMVVAKKLKYPAYAYLNERIAWKGFYTKFFVADEDAYKSFAKQVTKEKLQIVGNLMVDSVADLKKWAPETNVVTFMPGSRKWEIDYMTPFYKEVIMILRKQHPGLQFQIVSSPFVKADPIEGVKTIGFKDLYNSELVVTIPGTNTALIGARGIPMIVVFPLNKPEVIPMEGLAGLIGSIPFLGKAFKGLAANLINKKTRFFALPNQKGKSEIIPEIRGKITAAQVAASISSLLNNKEKRQTMSNELLKALGPAGAAKNIVEAINAGI
ncbi:MAG: hypothetical protein ABIH50_01420 [bacterium]